MFYVYILKSRIDKSFYYGFTTNLKERLIHHNSNSNNFTKHRTPYDLVWYGAFTDKSLALKFEKYLKSSSGHAFSRKRLLKDIVL